MIFCNFPAKTKPGISLPIRRDKDLRMATDYRFWNLCQTSPALEVLLMNEIKLTLLWRHETLDDLCPRCGLDRRQSPDCVILKNRTYFQKYWKCPLQLCSERERQTDNSLTFIRDEVNIVYRCQADGNIHIIWVLVLD